MKKNPLLALQSLGQSVWLDYLGRGAIDSGQLQCLIDQEAWTPSQHSCCRANRLQTQRVP
jgi:hypothetical protein